MPSTNIQIILGSCSVALTLFLITNGGSFASDTLNVTTISKLNEFADGQNGSSARGAERTRAQYVNDVYVDAFVPSVRFGIVTPTYPRHYEQNVRWLLTLLKNCRTCNRILVFSPRIIANSIRVTFLYALLPSGSPFLPSSTYV